MHTTSFRNCLTFALLTCCTATLQSVQAARPSDIFAANQALGRGTNLGNYLEAPRDASWGITIEDKHLAAIKAAGFDSVRIPCRWSDYTSKNTPYQIEPKFLRRVDHLLATAHRAKLNVVLNIHHYEELNNNPRAHKDRFVAIWKQIAHRYRDHGKWLYFEICNEPQQDFNEYWNEYLVAGLSAIRASNPTRPCIVGPPHWNGIWALKKLRLPADENLIVTVHMYNPHEFTHQGASWVEDRIRRIANREWGSAEELESLHAEMAQAATWAREQNRPLYLGEFGAYQAAPMSSRLRWTREIVRTAEKHGMSWAYWEFGAGFGAFDLDQDRWRKPILDTLIQN